MLTEEPSRSGESSRWRDLEENPFEVAAELADHRDLSVQTEDTLTEFQHEEGIEALERNASALEAFSEESSVKEKKSVADLPTAQAEQPVEPNHSIGEADVQAAISEARQNAETKLKAALEHVRQEEADRHAATLAGLRADLEREHAEALQRVQSAAVESINALTGNILGAA